MRMYRSYFTVIFSLIALFALDTFVAATGNLRRGVTTFENNYLYLSMILG